MFLVSLEVCIGAGVCLAPGAVDGFERAARFSMVTFTTLGYGDAVLAGTWRLLALIEAVNGIIMFGWTMAIVRAAVPRVGFGPKGGTGA
jgi:hypothetical protein